MALETNTLVNGEWTTRRLDVDTVLRHYDQQEKEHSSNLMDSESAPVLGLLTQTVVRSPLVHWILPVSLRNLDKHDVAFVGVSSSLLFIPYCTKLSPLLQCKITFISVFALSCLEC